MLIGWKAAVHDPRVASFRYRVQEPAAALRARGHAVELFAPERAGLYDLVIFSKSYRAADHEIAYAAKARGAAVALDLCDNHFYNPYRLPRYQKAREELLRMIALADRLIVSTPALGAVARVEAELAADPFVVGDIAERLALPPRATGGGKRLLWFGSHGSPNAPSGMNDLLGIRRHLQRAVAKAPFELVVASNNREKYDLLAPQMAVPSRYVEWTQAGFPALLAEADAVLIPLSDNPFVACKTHNRITAALWPGVPVVADVIESYREFAPFAWLDDWERGLDEVLVDPAAARARAAPARDHIDRTWTMDQLAPRWEEALGLSRQRPRAIVPPVEAAKPPAAPIRYQGALDPPRGESVTGWARNIARADASVRVALRGDGGDVAQARADQPRPDLAAAGFAHSGCGFILRVPPAWRDGEVRSYSVVVDGGHVLETQSRAFAVGGPPDEEPAAPSIDEQLRAVSELVAAVAAPQAGATADGVDPARVRDDMRLQRLLADELEALSDAVENVRRTAARIVLAAGSTGRDPGGHRGVPEGKHVGADVGLRG